MKRSILSGAVAIGLSILQSLLAQTADVTEAAKPLDEGVPEVAITRLRNLLGNNPPADEWRAAAEKLSEALNAAGRPDEALTLLDDPRLRSAPSSKFLRAQAFADLRRWNDALPLYEQIAKDKASPWRSGAAFGMAETLRALGRGEESRHWLASLIHDKDWRIRAQFRMIESYLDGDDARNARRMLTALEPASAAERKTKRLLQGRLEMAEQHPEKALAILEGLLKRPEGGSHSLVITTLFAVADAHLQLKTPETGDDFIEDFIDHQPEDVDLALLFSKLDELYRAEKKPARAELERWTREREQPRRALAQWYAARIDLRAGRVDHAVRLLGELRSSAPKSPDLAPAFIEFAQLQLDNGQLDDALSILNEARALQPDRPVMERIDSMAATVQFRLGQFDKARSGFERIANSNSALAKVSAFNAALSRLELGNDIRLVANSAGDDGTRAELRLEESLTQAGRGEQRATQTLQRFIRDFPQSPRIAEAYVALAELAFHRSPPDLDGARKYLTRASQSNPTPAADERAQYLSIWIEDATPGNDGKVIELAQRFLEKHAGSPFAADVRMKLAETYYRLQDFANAQTHFQILSQQSPPTPLTEKAMFFAGESAMSSMGENALDRALVLFDQVAQLNGELHWAARNEQALIERKLGKPEAALLLYEEILKSTAKPAEKREALCGKGDVYMELASSDPKNYQRAIESYDQLANDAHDPGHWRNQALFKKGMALEKKGDRDAALTTFYDVLQSQSRPGRAPEFFWFYKAGFNAARLLEENEKWESAVAVYQKLVAAAGPRTEEAKARVSRLRLEHFLWQE